MYKLQTIPHFARERHVFQQDRQCLGQRTLTNSDAKHNFWVYLFGSLARGDVFKIVRSERQGPVHDHNILGTAHKLVIIVWIRQFIIWRNLINLRFWESADIINTRSCAKLVLIYICTGLILTFSTD